MSARPKLGYIGIGLMGRPMTLRLPAAGYEVAVWNRSRNKLAPLGTNAVMLRDLENAAAVARETGAPLPMARTAAELYRLLGAQGGSECDPAMLVELLAGTR